MKLYLIAAVSAVMLFSSCKKDDPPKNYASQGPYTSMDDVYSKLAPPSKTVSMSVSSGGSVYSNGGTRFIITPNSFISGSGANVTGSVQVEVNDWLQKGDMIFGKVLPTTATESLLSGGQAYIRVTQNNQPVFLKPGKQVQINLPQFGKGKPGMQLFVGNRVEGAANNVNWVATDSLSNGSLVYNGDTISMFCDSLGYANADRFISSPNYQSFDIQVNSPDPSVEYIHAVAIYDAYKGMWPIGTRTNNVYHADHIPNIPVHLVVMGMKDGNFYAGMTAATPINGGTYTINVTKTDPATFKQQLNAL
jgi:hypothetical protein